MANLEEEDIIEDDSFRTVLSFSPEVQEAIDQVLDNGVLFLIKVGVVLRSLYQSRFVIISSEANLCLFSRLGNITDSVQWK